MCAQQPRHPEILQHGFERAPCVPSSTGTRKFYSMDLREAREPHVERAPCPATTYTQQHRHPEILQHGFERAPCVPSNTGTRKFSRRACSDPVQMWFGSGSGSASEPAATGKDDPVQIRRIRCNF